MISLRSPVALCALSLFVAFGTALQPAAAAQDSSGSALGAAAGTPAAKPPVPVAKLAKPASEAARKHHKHATPSAQAAKSTHAHKPAAKPAPAPSSPVAPTPADAAPAPPVVEQPGKGSVTGLPLPRFAALRADEVNLRTGPGTRYPIDWVYRRRDLPVQIEREFEVWRLVSDPDGVKGWVHQATLTGRRTIMVREPEQTLRSEPRDGADAVARLKPGVIGRLRSCAADAEWCEVQVGEYRGFLQRTQMWGLNPGEAVN